MIHLKIKSYLWHHLRNLIIRRKYRNLTVRLYVRFTVYLISYNYEYRSLLLFLILPYQKIFFYIIYIGVSLGKINQEQLLLHYT